MAEEPTKLEETGDQRDDKGRFLPGHEGMGGRPKISITAMIKEKLEEVPIGQVKSYAQHLVDKIIEKAVVDGNDAMLKEIWHYVDNLPTQPLSNPDGTPLVVKFSPEFEVKENGTPKTTSETKSDN